MICKCGKNHTIEEIPSDEIYAVCTSCGDIFHISKTYHVVDKQIVSSYMFTKETTMDYPIGVIEI